MDNIVGLILNSKRFNINEVDCNNSTALHQACSKGHFGIVKQLLDEKEINVNIQDDDGWTPLCCAVSEGHTKIVEMLLQRNDIDINTQSSDGVYIIFNIGLQYMKQLHNQTLISLNYFFHVKI